jgi:NIMA (never in mitosis gene a)-related kinase
MDGFEILEKLGDGAYSVVYKVKRKQDGNIYALKKVKLQNLSDKEKENALNEVRILASVKSTFVISYKEAFIEESEKCLCIVMEYADKGDLYQKITEFKKQGCLMEEIDVWRIFIQMTRGLKALHDLKILHRDLKSANIFLLSDGSAKIGDLNVSKVARKGLGYTQTGTPYYASPEVWNDSPYDSKSDIWSLGCITYEMLTLHPPFRAENMEALYNKVIKGNYPKISDKYSKDISDIIKLLLKVNPKDRLSCDQILKHDIIKKRLEFFQATNGYEDFDTMDEGVLLQTIRIPKNILFLTDKLPSANYGTQEGKKNTFPNKNLPDIKTSLKNQINNEKESKNLLYKRLNQNNNNNNNKNNKNNNIKEKKILEISNPNINSENEHKKKEIENKYLTEDNTNVRSIDNNILEKENKKYNQIKKQKILKQNEFNKYLKSIGLGDMLKIYSPNLDNNNYNNKKIIKKNIYSNNYIPGYLRRKYNNNSNNYNSNDNNRNHKIIPNKRLNPINRPYHI